jgi:hypothetical protein
MAWLTDTLPVGVEFAGGLTSTYGTASYNVGTNSVYWYNGMIPPTGVASVSNTQTPRAVALMIDSAPVGGSISSVSMPDAPISLILDDGSIERVIGLNGGGFAFQYMWFNRFTPDPTVFPFGLNQIDVYFSSNSNAVVGSPIDLVVYQDLDGNPDNGAELLRTITTTIQTVPGLNSFDLSADPVVFSGPGDVFIGVIDRYVNSGVTPSSYPSAQDSTTSQQRSWIAAWQADPPDPALLPTDYLYDVIDNVSATLAGNWIIRGYGETIRPEVITVTFNVTVTAESGYVTNEADLNYEGDSFMADSMLMVVAPPDVMFTSNSPVTLGEMAVFTPTVTGTGPFDYLWEFGDSITSTMEVPTHTYEMTGTYMVTVTVTSDWGMDSYSAEFVVNAVPVPPLMEVYLPLVWKAP